MNEQKHTPGPWHVVESAAGTTVKSDREGPIASVWGNADNTATAALIAAAPDMYEALQALATECRIFGASPRLTNAAFAALAKAEGR